MNSLWERFLEWICDTFGHKPDMKAIWFHDNKMHTNCNRCEKIITACYNQARGSTYWE